MASASLSRSFSEELLCSICLSVFTEPVMLQCGHSFCRECISVSLDQQKQCPVCRSPVEGKSLPTNHVLKSLVEKATQKLQYRSDKEKAELLCPEHDEKLKLYCITDQQLICVICRDSQKHQGHQFKPVSEAAALAREELQSLVQQISADTQALKLLVQSQKKEEDSTKRRSQDLTSLINIKFKEMQTFLLKRERELTDKVKSDEQTGLNKMADKMGDIDAAIAENTELENMLTSVLQIQDQEHFMHKWTKEKKSDAAQCFFKPKGGNFQMEKTELSLGQYESQLMELVCKEMLQKLTVASTPPNAKVRNPVVKPVPVEAPFVRPKAGFSFGTPAAKSGPSTSTAVNSSTATSATGEYEMLATVATVVTSKALPSLPSTTYSFGAKKTEGDWRCNVCLVQNKASDKKCAACRNNKPAMKKEPKGFGTFGSSFVFPTSGGFTFGTTESTSSGQRYGGL